MLLNLVNQIGNLSKKVDTMWKDQEVRGRRRTVKKPREKIRLEVMTCGRVLTQLTMT
jgi:hypothetical protein